MRARFGSAVAVRPPSKTATDFDAPDMPSRIATCRFSTRQATKRAANAGLAQRVQVDVDLPRRFDVKHLEPFGLGAILHKSDLLGPDPFLTLVGEEESYRGGP